MSGTNLEPIHVHLSKGSPSAESTKVWITKDGIELVNNNSNIPQSDLKKLLKYVANNRSDIIARWYSHFGM